MADPDMKQVVKDRYGKAADQVRADGGGCCASECDVGVVARHEPSRRGL